jgi:hypothetical protein
VFRRQVVGKLPRHGTLSWVLPPLGLYTPSILYPPVTEAEPPAVTVSPVIYVAPTVYLYQPAVVRPEPLVTAAQPETSVPRVVEHATGRYELRGDGTSTPYVWVWVPHPPPAPLDVRPSSDPREEPVRPMDRTLTYRWTDEDGTTFVTNRLDRVPESRRTPGPAR